MTQQRSAGRRWMIGWLVAACAAVSTTTALAGKPEGPVTGPVKHEKTCMLNNFVLKLQEAVTYIYQRRTYYFCCQGCVRRFAANPELFSKGVDPVSKKSVDKAVALLYARADTVYYFESAQHLQEFAADPDRYLKPQDEKDKKEETGKDKTGKPTIKTRTTTLTKPAVAPPATP